jgi:hypothetical protein
LHESHKPSSLYNSSPVAAGVAAEEARGGNGAVSPPQLHNDDGTLASSSKSSLKASLGSSSTASNEHAYYGVNGGGQVVEASSLKAGNVEAVGGDATKEEKLVPNNLDPFGRDVSRYSNVKSGEPSHKTSPFNAVNAENVAQETKSEFFYLLYCARFLHILLTSIYHNSY